MDHGVYCAHEKMFDTTTHVPLLLKDFDNAQAGLEVDSLVQHIDILPTLLHRLGISVPEECHGKSIWPAVSSPNKDVNEYVLCEHRNNYQRSIRSKEWQYTQSGIFPSKNGEPSPPEKSAAGDILLLEEPDTLFDRNDFNGANLIEKHPEITKALSRKMRSILDKCRKNGHDINTLPQAIKSQLENLGYF
jgi:arylsulfatase A-like enzyme